MGSFDLLPIISQLLAKEREESQRMHMTYNERLFYPKSSSPLLPLTPFCFTVKSSHCASWSSCLFFTYSVISTFCFVSGMFFVVQFPSLSSCVISPEKIGCNGSSAFSVLNSLSGPGQAKSHSSFDAAHSSLLLSSSSYLKKIFLQVFPQI